jgi:CRISPR-associated protein Csy1
VNASDDPAKALDAARRAYARDDFVAAFDASARAIAIAPTADALLLRANAAIRLERWGDAANALEALHVLRPTIDPIRRQLATCWLRHGNRARERDDGPTADSAYGRVLALYPDDADARYNLALLRLDQHRPDAALALLADDGADDAVFARARALTALDRGTEAIALLDRTLPRLGDTSAGRRALALLAEAGGGARASAIASDWFGSGTRTGDAIALADTLRLDGDMDAARELLANVRNRTSDPLARLRLALPLQLGLPIVAASHAALDDARVRYRDGLRALIDEYPPARVAALTDDPAAIGWDNFFLAYQGEDDRDLQRDFGAWLGACAAAIAPEYAASRTRVTRARPRIAIVSTFLRECTVGAYFLSWAAALSGAGFEVIAVQIGALADHWTDAFGRSCDRLVRLDGTPREHAAALRELDCDAIVYPELGMDRRTLLLAAWRLSPLQVCGWGHPSTTGLPTIDTYISCAAMEPPQPQRHYVEPLSLLPGIGTTYTTTSRIDSKREAGPRLPADRSLYLVPQSSFKLHPDVDGVLASIAARDPRALFVLFEGITPGPARRLRERLGRALLAVGAEPARHLHFLPMCPREDYLRINARCDVMVDSLRWSGGNATIDALQSGLPIVTCPGALMRGRQSAAMLRELGCAELIVDDAAALADAAVAIANDRERRDALSARISAGTPALLGDPRPLPALVAVIRERLERGTG